MNERRELTFSMQVKDIFKLTDGRTVLAGTLENGHEAILLPGRGQLFRDGHKVAEIQIEQELFHPGGIRDAQALYAVGTSDPINISSDDMASGEYLLTGNMRMREHRHLVGIDSPPAHFVPDRMTLGPRLPEGWDGDSWTSPDESRFFLRAWSKSSERYAVANGSTYEEARTGLLQEINAGGRPVQVSIREARGS